MSRIFDPRSAGKIKHLISPKTKVQIRVLIKTTSTKSLLGNLRPAFRMRPAAGVTFVRPAGPLEGKIIWINTCARVVGAARDKTQNSFSARGGKQVAHHWFWNSSDKCFKGMQGHKSPHKPNIKQVQLINKKIIINQLNNQISNWY